MAENIPVPHKSKKKHRKADAEADPEFQIAPMIDILLVLLVFFMSISSTEVLQSNQEVNLPIAKDAKDKPKKAPGQVIVNVLYSTINNATTIEVDEKVLTVAQLAPVLQTKATLSPQMRVVVYADRNVRYETMRSILETVGTAGIGNVTFAVVDKEQK